MLYTVYSLVAYLHYGYVTTIFPYQVFNQGVDVTVLSVLFHRDAQGEMLHGEWEAAKADYQNKHLHMSALQLLKTGDVSSAVGKDDSTDNRGIACDDLI